MVNSHPISVFLTVNFHPIALFYDEVLPHPRSLFLAGLTLLLTAPDMDPACEASLIVLG